MEKQLKIGGACGFWGETSVGTPQLLGVGGLDYLVYDYLAEITMSIMARARQKDPDKGYAVDFVTDVMARNLPEIAAKGVRVLSNAGGVNPRACAAALSDLIAAKGLDLKVAVVEGDDLLPRAADYAEQCEVYSGAPLPPAERILSMNAYLGAAPIVVALQSGADIVITGRCVDSALTLAACVHHFGWGWEEHDLLAAGSLAGHLLECGPQSTGGNFTDWRAAGDLAQIGYPVAEISADGAVVLTKPDGATGIVSPASVGEQMLYEIGDSRAYVLPDVVCDFSGVTLEQVGEQRVLVRGARGRAPTGQLKVSATWANGYRAGYVFQFNGVGARKKAEAFARMGLERARDRLRALQAPDYSGVCVETFGGCPGDRFYEEITLKVAVRHEDARAVGLFLKELIGAALATPPGLHGFTGAGRPKPSPVVELFSLLADESDVQPMVSVDGQDIGYVPPVRATGQSDLGTPAEPETVDLTAAGLVERSLEELAWARSGDKGDKANIGVIPRDAGLLPWIWAGLDDARLRGTFDLAPESRVDRFFLPGLPALNLLLHSALGGGGVASLHSDPQGKGFAQKLLSCRIRVPADLLARIN